MELLTSNLPFVCTMIGVIGVLFAMILAGFLGNAYLISTDAAIYVLATNVWGQFSSYFSPALAAPQRPRRQPHLKGRPGS